MSLQAAREHYHQGNRRLASKDYAGAVACFSRAIELAPSFQEAVVNRGSAKIRLGDYEGAIRDLTSGVSLRPTDPLAYANRGLARDYQGDLAGASRDLTQAIALDPSQTNFCNRGSVRSRSGDLAGAIEDCTIAIEKAQDATVTAMARCFRGDARRLMGDPAAAVQDYTVAEELLPRYEKALTGRMMARYLTGDYPGAVVDAGAVLSINPASAEAWAWRGGARSKLGEDSGALEDLEKALELGSKEGKGPLFDMAALLKGTAGFTSVSAPLLRSYPPFETLVLRFMRKVRDEWTREHGEPPKCECGRPVTVDSLNCPACGRSILPGGEAEKASPPRSICGSCGADAYPGAKFCSKCGSPVPVAAPPPAPPEPAPKVFCPQCGTLFLPAARFCASCGTASPEVRSEPARPEATKSPGPAPKESEAPSPAPTPAPRPASPLETPRVLHTFRGSKGYGWALVSAALACWGIYAWVAESDKYYPFVLGASGLVFLVFVLPFLLRGTVVLEGRGIRVKNRFFPLDSLSGVRVTRVVIPTGWLSSRERLKLELLDVAGKAVFVHSDDDATRVDISAFVAALRKAYPALEVREVVD